MRLIGVGQVHDGDDRSAGTHAALHRWNQIALQVVAVDDQIESGGRNFVLAAFQVSDVRVDIQIFLAGALTQEIDCDRRAVDRGDTPTELGQEQRIAPWSAGQIERRAGLKRSGEFFHQRRRSFKQLLAGLVASIPVFEAQLAWPRFAAAFSAFCKIRTARSISFSVTM